MKDSYHSVMSESSKSTEEKVILPPVKKRCCTQFILSIMCICLPIVMIIFLLQILQEIKYLLIVLIIFCILLLIVGVIRMCLFGCFSYCFYVRKHDGWTAKISTFLKFQIPAIEKMRWTFIPVDESKRTRTLICSFGGGAMRVALQTPLEFKNTLAAANIQCDQLYVMDPNMSWYMSDPFHNWNGFQYHQNKLEEITREYEKVMFIGNCLGASGALLFSHLADRVLAFSPHIDFTIITSSLNPYKIGSLLNIKRTIRSDFKNIIEKSCSNCPRKQRNPRVQIGDKKIQDSEIGENGIYIYTNMRPMDQQQSYLLNNLPRVHVHTYKECTVEVMNELGSVPRWLKKKGELASLIANHYTQLIGNL